MILLAHSYFLRHDPKQLGRMQPYAPLATLIAAALLRQRGHDVVVFDAMLAAGTDEFAAALDQHRPAVVGILEDNFNFLTKMCTLRMRADSIAMVEMARQRGCRVAVNGSDASDHPALYLNAGAHAVIRGEGEMAFADLADAWRSDPDAALHGVRGLVILDAHGAVTHTLARQGLRDLDSLPLPAWDLVDVPAYRGAWRSAHGRFSWNMVTSRGCPFHCNWCAKPIFGQRYAQRSPALVAKEMRCLKDDIAPDHLWFADDIFGVTREWIGAFAEEVTERDARIPFMIQSRVDLMSPEVVDALAAAGAHEVWMGVESGSQRILDAMDKGTTIEAARTATRTLKSRGIRACWFIQLGYLSETWDDLLQTRDALRDERPDDIGVSVAYPLPNTKFRELVQAQMGAREHWDDTGDLAMLFKGTYSTAFYRQVRDVLHAENRTGMIDDGRWDALAHDAAAYVADGRRAMGT
jgi:anaerobic magnesium-protoporphyrin IX monomethyl ester cyclase